MSIHLFRSGYKFNYNDEMAQSYVVRWWLTIKRSENKQLCRRPGFTLSFLSFFFFYRIRPSLLNSARFPHPFRVYISPYQQSPN
jgi:hypothetical protein